MKCVFCSDGRVVHRQHREELARPSGARQDAGGRHWGERPWCLSCSAHICCTLCSVSLAYTHNNDLLLLGRDHHERRCHHPEAAGGGTSRRQSAL